VSGEAEDPALVAPDERSESLGVAPSGRLYQLSIGLMRHQ
jgi:hypothetical protein